MCYLGQTQYIFHMINSFTRLSISIFLKNKKPEMIMHNLMRNYVAEGYGWPGKLQSDVEENSTTTQSGSWQR